MTSYVRHCAWYAKMHFQNIPLLILNNFNHYQLVVRTKFKGLRRQLSSPITEKLLSNVSKWRHMSDTGHDMQKKIQNIPFIIFNNFNNDQLVLKINYKGLKRHLSSQILKKVTCPTLGMVCKNIFFFWIFPLIYSTNSTMNNLSRKPNLRA